MNLRGCPDCALKIGKRLISSWRFRLDFCLRVSASALVGGAIVDKRWGNLTSFAGATLIIRAMKRRARHTMAVARIKPAEGVCIVMLFLAALLVVLWAVFIAVRLVLV